jgi:hypothetical protein
LVVKTFGTAGGTQPIANFQRSDAAVNFQIGFNGNTGDNFAGTTTNHNLFFITNNTEKLRLDTSGNLGLGVTPSAWSVVGPVLQINNAAFYGYQNQARVAANAYYDGSNFKYIASAAACEYRQAGGQHQWLNAASGTAGNAITFTQAMALDANGNLVLGTTSALSSSYRITSYGGRVNFAGNSDALNLYLQYNNGTLGAFIGSPAANVLAFSDSGGTERARIDASGNLLVGTTTQVITSKATILSSNDGGVATCLDLYNNGSSAGSAAELRLSTAQSGSYAGTFIRGVAVTANNSALTFGTEGSDVLAERARITSGGYFKASDTGTYAGSTASYHEFITSASNRMIRAQNSNASPFGFLLEYTGAAPNGTGNEFFICSDTGATRATIRSNGGLANYQANNVDLSDARTKNSITPAASMWDKVAALEIVTYKYNDQTHDDVNLGVIAQQVEAVEPVWVDNDGWGDEKEGEEPLKTVYTKDITFAAIKALQEAMARIEQLEAKVAVLENK